MSQLDSLIERLKSGEELLLESGKDPSIRTHEGLKPVINKPVTAQQILSLIYEIAPQDKKSGIKSGAPAAFIYTVASGRYAVSCVSHGENVTGIITRIDAPDAPTVSADDDAPRHAETSGKEPEINLLFRKMVEMGSSDLHLTSNSKPLIRASGDIAEISDQPVITPAAIKRMLYEIMPRHNIAQFEENHDTDFPYEIAGLARFRANIFKDRNGMGAVFRQIPLDIVSAEKLGLSKEVMELCFLSKGLVLVTGPTGSGKSTTLCALIDYINRNRKCHIITIEDPIEFVHPQKKCLINQREVHVHTKSFSTALRAALREDPDIMLVGEMRDLETIAIAIETAETGHLVFGTLHTTTAASTVDRIVDQFPADRQSQIKAMLSTSLKGVISQTLCKKIGGGRAAAQEILFITPAVSNLIREGKVYQIPSVIQTSRGQGMVMLNDALVALVTDKVVAPEEALAKAVDKTGLLSLLKAKGITVNITGMS